MACKVLNVLRLLSAAAKILPAACLWPLTSQGRQTSVFVHQRNSLSAVVKPGWQLVAVPAKNWDVHSDTPHFPPSHLLPHQLQSQDPRSQLLVGIAEASQESGKVSLARSSQGNPVPRPLLDWHPLQTPRPRGLVEVPVQVLKLPAAILPLLRAVLALGQGTPSHRTSPLQNPNDHERSRHNSRPCSGGQWSSPLLGVEVPGWQVGASWLFDVPPDHHLVPPTKQRPLLSQSPHRSLRCCKKQ
mmetsp:Transcript_3215/g.7430  ORF Transcript_3215/g.7430 Transcript_3215/m.7430 type:complete len:243 (+) Transcript_3215:492-1220(+)